MAGAEMILPSTPIVSVVTTNNRGQTPEELGARCAERLISVSEGAPPAIRDQAIAFRSAITQIVTSYLREAVTNDRVTVYNAIKDAGHPSLAELIRRL